MERVAETAYNSDYWKMGMNGAMFQMIAHGLSSAGMFFLVGVVYERVHHRDLDQFGGLFARMPLYSGLSIGIFFAALGLPGLCGFIGEFFVVFSAWSFNNALAVVAASVVILTAGYILWTIQRVYLGPEYKGPHGEALSPATKREVAIAAPLLAFALLLGVYPQALFNYTGPSVNATVEDLAAWTKGVKDRHVTQSDPGSRVGVPALAGEGTKSGKEKPPGGGTPTGPRVGVPALAGEGTKSGKEKPPEGGTPTSRGAVAKFKLEGPYRP